MRLVQFERRDGARGVGVLDAGGVTDLFEAGYSSALEAVRAATDEGGLIAVVGAAVARAGPSSRLPPPGPAAPYRLRVPIDPPEVWASAPSLFLKGTARICVGPDEAIVVRADSRLTVAQPRLAAVLDGAHRVVAYALAGDVAARDLAPAGRPAPGLAASYAGSCALGPMLVSADDLPDPQALALSLRVLREGRPLVEARAAGVDPGRPLADLVAALVADNPVPAGTLLLAGPGLPDAPDLALEAGDVVEIDAEPLGRLRTSVRRGARA